MGVLSSGYSVGALFVVFALLMVIIVATDTFVNDDMHFRSRFWMLFTTTAIAGVCASVLMEQLNVRILVDESA